MHKQQNIKNEIFRDIDPSSTQINIDHTITRL